MTSALALKRCRKSLVGQLAVNRDASLYEKFADREENTAHRFILDLCVLLLASAKDWNNSGVGEKTNICIVSVRLSAGLYKDLQCINITFEVLIDWNFFFIWLHLSFFYFLFVKTSGALLHDSLNFWCYKYLSSSFNLYLHLYLQGIRHKTVLCTWSHVYNVLLQLITINILSWEGLEHKLKKVANAINIPELIMK